MTHPPIDQQITFLYTRDLATTAQFYEEILGLRLALDQGDCRIYRAIALQRRHSDGASATAATSASANAARRPSSHPA